MKKILAILLFFNIIAFGHPHMFVSINLDIENEGKDIHKVGIEWVFDEMSSSMLIMDYDKNRDKKFSKSESADFKKNVFDTLGEFSYYTHLKVDSRKINLKSLIKNVTLKMRGHKFVVSYFLDLSHINVKKSLNLGFWDREFYSSMELMGKNVKLKEKIPFKIDEIQDDIYLGYILKVKK